MITEAWAMIPKIDKDKTGVILEIHPIVLCKNCKYGESVKNAKGEPMIECALCNKEWLKEPDWFCADGERCEKPE